MSTTPFPHAAPVPFRPPPAAAPEAEPSPQPMPAAMDAASASPAGSRWMAGLLLGVALIASVQLFDFTGTGPAAVSDRVPPQQAQQIQSQFSRINGGLLPVDLSNPREREKVVAAMPLPAPEAEQAIALAQRGERAIGWVKLWDNFQQDGDVVSITAGGITQVVPIFNQPTAVPVIYVPGQPLLIHGVKDGGGGITVAVELTTGPVALPPMSVGQVIELPVQ